MIDTNTGFWNDIVTDTFGKQSDEEHAEYKSAARRVMARSEGTLGLFAKKLDAKQKYKLAFSASAIKKIKDELVGGSKNKLDPNLVPTWKEYIDPTTQTKPVAGKEFHGQIGLRMGVYGDKGDPYGQKGTDRESHHTVQYLLMEYFSNTLKKQPFGGSLKSYPNLEADGGNVKKIMPEPGADKGIEIDAGSRRGPKMPTILLARDTHHAGVHVTPSADEDSTSSQGQTVHEWFGAALGNFKDLVREKDMGEQRAAIQAVHSNKKPSVAPPKIDGAVVTSEILSKQIHAATNKTYNKIRKEMNTKLAGVLDIQEGTYYGKLVAQATDPKIVVNGRATKDYKHSPVKAKVMADVQRRQRTAFDSFGFKTTGG
jgi:hypothetical protein